MWTPAGNDRYTWEYQPDGGTPDPDRPRRLVDPGDGSLVEADGPSLIRYPSAYLDNGNIWNESGQCWVVQDSTRGTEWDPRSEDFWALLEQATSPEHPVWESARRPEETKAEVPAPRPVKAKPAEVQPGDATEAKD